MRRQSHSGMYKPRVANMPLLFLFILHFLLNLRVFYHIKTVVVVVLVVVVVVVVVVVIVDLGFTHGRLAR